jgi:flagellar hook assembly protein FlgD
MDNTLVTITDAAGNLVHKGTSEGGILTWDGCDLSGERVKTGVYFVFASNGTSTSSSNASCVTKIMVIN